MTATMCNLTDDLDYCRHGFIRRTCRKCILGIDDLETDYPSIGPLFAEKGVTASELDKFLSMMEAGMNAPDAPQICVDDCVSLHGDLVLIFADMVGPEKL